MSVSAQDLAQLELASAPVVPRQRRNLWVLRRVLVGLATLVALSIVIFAATQALPGNAAKEILGHNGTPAEVATLTHQLGLDRPVVSQYLSWAGHAVTGNFGSSLANREPVTTLLDPAILKSAILLFLSATISLIVAFALGVLAAARRDRAVDHAINAFSFFFTAVPEFVIALWLVMLFGTTVFKILPAVSLFPPGAGAFSDPQVYVLPVATLVLATVPYLTRLVRGSMIDAMESQYVRMARYKGLSERRILVRHALPNALVPAIQGMAQNLGYLAGGIVVIEYVFGFPGIGTALTQAIGVRDIPVVQASSLILASFYVVVNLIADLLVVFVTPRLRTGG
ncbi:MAG TPA: ABC transporter permease [Solirubrobacteraceae bacterium]|nr:ABC transporter permease [Solirubrobacteraceae bacterium]